MYEFFQEIVRYREDSAKAFTHSPLAAVFERLLASEAEGKAEAPRGSVKRTWDDEEPLPVKHVPGRLQESRVPLPVRASVKRVWPDEDPPAVKRK